MSWPPCPSVAKRVTDNVPPEFACMFNIPVAASNCKTEVPAVPEVWDGSIAIVTVWPPSVSVAVIWLDCQATPDSKAILVVGPL